MDFLEKNKQRLETEKRAVIESIKSFYVFFRNFWHVISAEDFVDNWHIHYLCYELQRLGIAVATKQNKISDYIINVPPGTTKTSIVSIAWPVWMWLIRPSTVTIKTSYSGDLSLDANIKANLIYKSDRFQRWFQPYFLQRFGSEMYLIKDNERDFRNNFGGMLYSSSTGGTVTGKHAHILVRDDPISAEQAESEAHREKANRFNDRTLTGRKIDKATTPTVTVMQRLHHNDPTGHDLKKDKKGKLRHICLPAEDNEHVKPAEARKFYQDGLLDPNRLNKTVLENFKKDLGSYGYAGQMMQNPVPEGGGKVKKAWFQYIHEKELPNYLIWELWIDGAYTKRTENDPTGFMITAYDPKHNRLYIKHAVSDFLEMPDLLKFVPEYAANNQLTNQSRVYIEPKASGKSLAQLLNYHTILNAVEIESGLVLEGKNARLQTASPKIESGRVFLVEGAWNDHFISQLTDFPVADHDEYVDLMGYAVDFYFSASYQEEGQDYITYEDRVNISEF